MFQILMFVWKVPFQPHLKSDFVTLVFTSSVLSLAVSPLVTDGHIDISPVSVVDVHNGHIDISTVSVVALHFQAGTAPSSSAAHTVWVNRAFDCCTVSLFVWWPSSPASGGQGSVE